MNPDQTAPSSSLIWVYTVCNIGYLRTKADERNRQQIKTGMLRVKFTIISIGFKVRNLSLGFATR